MKKKIMIAFIIVFLSVIFISVLMLIRFLVRYEKYLDEIMKPSVQYEKLHKQYPKLTRHIFDIIDDERHGVPPETICAIIDAESGFDVHAESKSGDYGLMQINKCHRLKNSFDPRTNIRFGVKHFRYCLIRSRGNNELALMMYNSGCNRKEYHNQKYAMRILGKIDKSHGIMLATL